MTKEELTNWFLEEFWPRYLTLVKTPFATKWRAGPRGQALQKIISMNPSEELRKTIVLAIEAQIHHRRKVFERYGSMETYTKATERNKLYCNRMGSTWLNQMGWMDEIPSIESKEEMAVEGQLMCLIEGCNNYSMGPGIPYCASCYPDTRGITPELKKHLKKSGLWKREDETVEQWRARCRETGRQALRQMIGGKTP